jgi:mono/diheme cytochrome c family protein
MKRVITLMLILSVFGFYYGQDTTKTDPNAGKKTDSPHSTDNGIGPVKSVKLGPIDKATAAKGKALFDEKCAMCHLMKEKKIGPPLQDVTLQRTPEFIMNLIINPTEMEQKDTIVKKLLSEYHVPMPDLSLSQEQAREILEYLRTMAPKAEK